MIQRSTFENAHETFINLNVLKGIIEINLFNVSLIFVANG